MPVELDGPEVKKTEREERLWYCSIKEDKTNKKWGRTEEFSFAEQRKGSWVCHSRQKRRTPAPGQRCWTTALGPVSRKGIHARLRPGLKSYMVVYCSLARKKKAKGLEIENSGTIKHENNSSQGIGWPKVFISSVDRRNWAGGKCKTALAKIWPGENKAEVKAGSKRDSYYWLAKPKRQMSDNTVKLNEGMHQWKGKGRGQEAFRAKGCPKGPWHLHVVSQLAHPFWAFSGGWIHQHLCFTAWLALAAIVALKQHRIMQEDFVVLISLH